MKTIKEYQRELLLGAMILVQCIAIFLPYLFPEGLVELILLGMLFLLILMRIQKIDLALKRKYN